MKPALSSPAVATTAVMKASAAPARKPLPAWLGWGAAMTLAIGLHGAVALYFWWQPDSQLALPPAAAPQVFEINMVAAPESPSSDLPIDQQQQQESSPAPQQQSQVQQVEAAEEPLELASNDSDIVLQQRETEEQPEEQPTEEPQQQQPQTAQQQNNSGEATGEQRVEESTAPLAMEAPAADAPAAPQVGALNERANEARMTWQSELQAHLERRKRYPRKARMRHQQGVPWVRFVMDREGNVLDATLHRASGYAALDREVVALVKRAQPLPPPPQDIPGDPLTMAVPVEFFIR